MAEGGQEDDSGDVKRNSPHKLDAGDAPLNLKSEVSSFHLNFFFLQFKNRR